MKCDTLDVAFVRLTMNELSEIKCSQVVTVREQDLLEQAMSATRREWRPAPRTAFTGPTLQGTRTSRLPQKGMTNSFDLGTYVPEHLINPVRREWPVRLVRIPQSGPKDTG